MRPHMIGAAHSSDLATSQVSLLIGAETVASSTVWGRVGHSGLCIRNVTWQKI